MPPIRALVTKSSRSGNGPPPVEAKVSIKSDTITIFGKNAEKSPPSLQLSQASQALQDDSSFMKIGLVRRGFSPTGGAENYLRRLADALERAGHEPVLFTTPDWPRDQWPAHRGLVRVPGRDPHAFADGMTARASDVAGGRLFSLERVWRCDCYRAGDGVHRVWLERRARIEPVWRRWVRHANPKHRRLLALEKNLFARGGARTIIANSRLVRDEIVRVYGTSAERISVVYNGLPAGHLQPVAPDRRDRERAALTLEPSDYVVLFAGTGWERKGLAHALAALELLPDSLRARLLVAGRGNPRPFLRRLSPRTWERVRFLGPVRDMAACYAAADVFVAPTLYDPFSNACLEALAAGLPVLTTSANGCAEIIAAGVEGEVFETEDRWEGRRLAELLTGWSDPARRAEARLACRAKAAGFTIERNVAETLAVLLEGRQT